MTPAERQEFQRLVCDFMDAQYADFRQATRIFAPRPDLKRFDAALSALTAFVERLTEARLAEVIEERELWRRAQIREEDALRDALAKLAEAERERDAIREAAKLDVQFAHELAEDKVEAIRADLAGAASERDKLADECNKLAGMVDTLRAERDTLVPLARLGIVALDDDDGRFPSGDAIRFGVLNGRFEETSVVARARALLRREEEA